MTLVRKGLIDQHNDRQRDAAREFGHRTVRLSRTQWQPPKAEDLPSSPAGLFFYITVYFMLNVSHYLRH
jgi:hypothetical protein